MIGVRGPVPHRRIGVVASFDFDRDRELWRWVPEDVPLFIARTGRAPMEDNFEFVRALNDPAMLTEPAQS
jgi:maleate isomerase